MFSLIYHQFGEPKRYELPLGSTTVGRASNCDVVLNDDSVSRAHARFDVTTDACIVTDTGSTNGTSMNDEPIKVRRLQDGDVVVLGSVPIQIEQSAADRLTLSEGHELIETPGTIFRRISEPSAPGGGVAAASDTKRLLRLISDVAGMLVHAIALSEVLDRVVDLTFDTIPAERAFLILIEPSTRLLVPRVARTREGKQIAGGAQISRTIVNRVLTERVAILAADVQADASFQTADSIVRQAIRSFMCVPLWNQNDVIGVLYVDTPLSQRFTAADLDLFTAMSNYAAVAIEQARLGARLLEETRRRERLQRYHSPSVVSRIIDGGEDADAPFITQERDLTVLFADIVGFTSIAERLLPGQVAQLLNSYLGVMTDIVFEHEGTLDKFIGDAVMAVFGAPLDQPDHPIRAVRAARDMRAALSRLNERRASAITMRIGIHSGTALAGDIGSRKRREYTVLGDVVNTASRLEKVAEPGQIIVSGATFERLGGQIPGRSRGSIGLRGRSAAVEIVEILD